MARGARAVAWEKVSMRVEPEIERELAERIESLAPGWWVKRCRLGGPWDQP